MHTLMTLPYAYEALEPWIDAATMEIHHGKHHQTYVNNFNKALENYPDLAEQTPEELIADLNKLEVDDTSRSTLRNMGGGVVNHNFFWLCMDPSRQPDTALQQEIITKFGSIEEFKKQFSAAALKNFGSGWTWLVRQAEGDLAIINLPNQDSPLSNGQTPLLTIDIWEHAYYLKYQNRRQEYIDNWWQTIKFI